MKLPVFVVLTLVATPFVLSSTAAGVDDDKGGKNLPPVCVVPGDIEVQRQGPTTTVILDGSASFDPEGDDLRYRWVGCPDSTIVDNQAPITEIIIDTPAGETTVCPVRLTVFDGMLKSICRLFITVTDPGVCLVIIDEDTIDNDVSTIEAAASDLNVESDALVNDNNPTETSNPPLLWNQIAPGDVILLPGGQVDDEGLFALPPNPPFSVEDFANGVVPQSHLDPIFDVMPLRNHELFGLVGLMCTGIVYDSDISMNFHPIQGNLQGARYGSFTFTVLEVVVAGSIDESQSSTSLYDLLVRVEEPQTPTFAYEVEVRDHEPDSIQIVQADWSNGVVRVSGTSNFAPGAQMTVSIEDFVTEAPMVFNSGVYEFEVAAPSNLDGRRVTISTDAGGAYNSFID